MENENIQKAINLLNDVNSICQSVSDLTELDDGTKEQIKEKLTEANAKINQTVEELGTTVGDNETAVNVAQSAITTDQGKTFSWWGRRRRRNELIKLAHEALKEYKHIFKAIKRQGGTKKNYLDIATPQQRARLDFLLAEINKYNDEYQTLLVNKKIKETSTAVVDRATPENTEPSLNTSKPQKKLGWWARRRVLKAIAKEELELYDEFKELSKRVRGSADSPYGNASPAQRARLDYILARINELEEQVSSL